MAKMQLIIELNPELNKGQMLSAAKEVRSALGDAVKGINFSDVASGAGETAKGLENVAENAVKAQGAGKGIASAFAFNQVVQSVREVSSALNEVISVSNEFESMLAAVGAITGFSGDALSDIGDKARQLAKEFGGSASSQLQSFQGILSKLGPQVAENADALALFGKNVSILSAASGDDAATSMSAITDSMLQFGLVSGDAAKDAETSTKIINALAASAQVGAAEIPQVAQAILQAGVAAKGAKMPFEETNAAIQVLAVGGKVGSEAGVALRNVLGMMQKASGPAAEAMNKLGTSTEELGNLLTEQGFDVALGKLKSGMDNVGSAAEKNALLMQIFGTENSAAAGILLDNLDKYSEFVDGIKAGQEGAGSAFEQAAQRMDTADGVMSRLKATMEDVFISVGQTLGSSASAFLGFSNSIAPTVAAMAGIKNVLPTQQIGQLSLTILSKLVPSLVMSDVATKSLVFNKSALSAANLREAATNAVSITGKYAHAAATWALTTAQSALNLAMSLNPIGLIIVGLAAAAAAVYLLYQNFESVREIIDSVFSAIGDAASYIGNIFSGVSAAVSAVFGDSGRTAGEAFSQGFAESKLKESIEDTSKSLSEKLTEGVKIKVKVDSEASMPGLIAEYEKIQSRLDELRDIKSSGSLTSGEQEEFKKLELAAESASAKIQKIAPETKGAARSVVDEMGNLRLVYDLNIEKAKEFSKTGANSGQLKKAAQDYSSELTKQAENIEKQIFLNNKNLEVIDKVYDEKRKQQMTDKFNEENASIEKNRKALVESFLEGAKAGLVTSDAIDKIAKTMGMSSEEARKMLVAKALDEAAKSGKVTEDQVAKIAEKFNFSKDKAKELYAEQVKNTEEAKKTAEAAKDIAVSYDEVKKKLEEQRSYNVGRVLAYEQMIKENKKLSAEQLKDYEQKKKFADYDSRQLKQRNQLEAEINERYSTSAETQKKTADARSSAYELAKKEYEQNKQVAEQAKKASELKQREAQLDSGRLETAVEKRNRELEILRLENVEFARRRLETAKLVEAASKETDKKKKADYLAEIAKLQAQLELDIQNNVIAQKEIVFAANIDRAKIKEEVDKINSDSAKSKLKFDIELGKENQSKLIEFEIGEMQKKIDTISKKLKFEISLGASGDESAIAGYKAQLLELNREVATQSRELSAQVELERIELIADADERAYRLRLVSAESVYRQDLAASGINEQKKLASLMKYQSEKLAAEQEYLRRKSGLYSTLDALAEGLKGVDLSQSKKNVAEEIKSVEQGRKQLEEQFRKREITTSEYFAKDRELTDKAEKLKNQQSAVNWSAATAVISESLKKQADVYKNQIQVQSDTLQAISAKELELSQKTEQLKTDMLAAGLAQRYDLWLEYHEKMVETEAEKEILAKKRAEAEEAFWTNAMNSMAIKFVDFSIQSDKIGKSMAKALFSTTKAMVPSFVALIFGQSIKDLGPVAGAIASGALTATLYGLLSLAEAAVSGYRGGGYTGDGNPNEVAGVVHKGEYVMPAGSTARNKRAFMEIDKGGMTVEGWYEMRYADKIQKQISEKAMQIAGQANLVYSISQEESRRENRELADAIRENSAKLDKLASEVKKGNYMRKTKVEYDLNVSIDKDKMLKAVEKDRYKKLQRG